MPLWKRRADPQPVVIAGNSHISSFGVPAKAASGVIERVPIEGEPGFIGLTGPSPRQRSYWDELIRMARRQPVALLWAGNQHNARFMLPPGSPFDFFCSARPDLGVDSAVRLLPESAVRAVFQPSLEGLTWLVGELAKVSPLPPVIVGTPPPKQDNEAIRAMLAREQAFVDIARQLGTDLSSVRMSTPTLRLKLWCELQQQMAQVALEKNVPFCAVPDELVTPEGFLRPEFWVRDATHANQKYGRIMLRAIERHLG